MTTQAAAQADKPKTSPTGASGIRVLFDGKSLEGWSKCDFYKAGEVKVENGMIVMTKGVSMSGITTTRHDLPTTNYELRYEAMRLEGQDFFAAATFPVGKSFITLVNGGWGGGVTGLSSLDGMDASENDTTRLVRYQDKTWYHFRVRVTDKMIHCQIDDKEIIAVSHRDRRVSTRIETRRNQPLGFATYECTGMCVKSRSGHSPRRRLRKSTSSRNETVPGFIPIAMHEHATTGTRGTPSSWSQTKPSRTRLRAADIASGSSIAHDPYTVLRDANFRVLVLAGMVATVGNQMQGVAIGWELYERTSSPLALGMVGLAQVLPVILLAIPAGHAADRYSRKHLIILAHVMLLLATVGLAVISAWRGPVGLTYLFLVVTGAAQALNRPARWAILPQVVPRELLMSAVTWNTSAWQIAAMAGPALGGVVIAVAGGATTCYLLNAGCSAMVIALTASLRLHPVARDAQPVTVRSLLAGLGFVFRTDLILATITLDMFAVFLGGADGALARLRPRHPRNRPHRPGLAPRCRHRSDRF